jgi:hypothetical protein
MKKFALLATISLIGLAALSLTGCIQAHSDTVIEKDGSGTATLTMSMSPAMTEVIQEMEELDMTQGQEMDVPKFDDINKDDLVKAAKGHGVKITKFEKGTVDGREKLDIAMDFEDLKSLSYVMGSLMGGNPGEGMGIYETADGNFVLKQATYDFPPEPAGEVEDSEPAPKAEDQTEKAPMTPEEKSAKQMEIYGKLMSTVAELDVRLTVTVPGEIIESNAPTVEGNTSIWAINSSNMMNQQDQDMEPVITFSSKGLKIKALKE